MHLSAWIEAIVAAPAAACARQVVSDAPSRAARTRVRRQALLRRSLVTALSVLVFQWSGPASAEPAAQSDCTRTVQERVYWGPVSCYAYPPPPASAGPFLLMGNIAATAATTQPYVWLQEWVGSERVACQASLPFNQLRSRQIAYCAPEELYIAQGSGLYAVDGAAGTGYRIDALLTDANAMAATRGLLYEVVGGQLRRVNPETGAVVPFSAYPDGWSGTEAMTALGDSLYAVQAGTLWRVNVNDGSVSAFGDYSDSWAGTEAMTALGDSLYAVQAGTLWRVNVNNGSISAFGAYADNWPGTAALAARDGFIYGVQADALWRVRISNGSIEQIGVSSWAGTRAMVAR